MVKSRTQAYLSTAERNRDLARDMRFATLNTRSSDWAAVIAFYSALHFVHAYLFEKVTQNEKLSHKDRERYVEDTDALKPAERYYDDLYEISIAVRYDPRYRIQSSTEQEALDNLTEIERIVRRGLAV